MHENFQNEEEVRAVVKLFKEGGMPVDEKVSFDQFKEMVFDAKDSRKEAINKLKELINGKLLEMNEDERGKFLATLLGGFFDLLKGSDFGASSEQSDMLFDYAKNADVNFLYENRQNLLMKILIDDSIIKTSSASDESRIVRELIKKMNDINIQDIDGKTALIHAIESGYLFATNEILVKEGVNINLKDKSGKTPLDYALLKHKNLESEFKSRGKIDSSKEENNKEIIVKLLQNNAKTTTTNKKDYKILQKIAKEHNKEISNIRKKNKPNKAQRRLLDRYKRKISLDPWPIHYLKIKLSSSIRHLQKKETESLKDNANESPEQNSTVDPVFLSKGVVALDGSSDKRVEMGEVANALLLSGPGEPNGQEKKHSDLKGEEGEHKNKPHM